MERQGWRFPPERRDVLKSEERQRRTPPDQILSSVDLQAGSTVVDLGAGTGFWTEPVAHIVGTTGTVYAVDVEPIMLDDLRAAVRNGGLDNVQVVESSETSVPLPDGIADLIIVSCVLHEPPEPDLFLREVVRLIKPDGKVLVIDWHQKPTQAGPPLEHRISEEEARALLGNAGLTVEEIPSASDEVYVLVAQAAHPGTLEQAAPTY